MAGQFKIHAIFLERLRSELQIVDPCGVPVPVRWTGPDTFETPDAYKTSCIVKHVPHESGTWKQPVWDGVEPNADTDVR